MIMPCASSVTTVDAFSPHTSAPLAVPGDLKGMCQLSVSIIDDRRIQVTTGSCGGIPTPYHSNGQFVTEIPNRFD
jgi:hypothetical protein